MSYERDDPYFDLYSNSPKSVNDEIKSILRRTTDTQSETRHNIFEPSQSSYYKESEKESHWRSVDNRNESAHLSTQGSYASNIASMPIFTEDTSSSIGSNYASSKFPKSINAELYAKALAVKSDLGLLPDSQNQNSSALEALRSYGAEFQNSPPASPYQQRWRPRDLESSRHQPTAVVEQHYHNQTFSPLKQVSSQGELSNELFEQMKSMICSSNPIDSPKPLSGSSYLSSKPIDESKSTGSMNLLPGFNSIEDEDQFLYGDSDSDKPEEIKDVQTYDSQSKAKKVDWSNENPQNINEVASSKVMLTDTSKSGRTSSFKSDKPITSDEFHAIDLKLQPNVWKNPSIWDMPSGDDVYSHTESGKRSKKEEILFDVKHDRNKRLKLDPIEKHTESRRSNIDRGKTSTDFVDREKPSTKHVKQHNSSTSDKKAGLLEQHSDRFQKQSVTSDKSIKEKVSPHSSYLDQKSTSKKNVPLAVEKKVPPNTAKQFNLHDHMAESSKSKFHYAAELLKTRCTKAVFDAETPSVAFNSPKVTRECSNDMSTKFEKAEFSVKQEPPDSPESLSSADKKAMQKLLINVGQGETFSAKRTVRVKNPPSKEAEILGSMVQEFIKQSEMSDKSSTFNMQHHRIVRSIKNDNSPKCLLKEPSKSPEKKSYPSLGSSKEFSTNLNISGQNYLSSFNPVKTTTKILSKDSRSSSRGKGSPKKLSSRSSRTSSSDSTSSRTHSSDSSKGRSVGSISPRRRSRKSQSPKHYSRDSASPRRGFRASPRRSRDGHSPKRRSNIPKHYSRSNFSPSPTFNLRRSRSPKRSPNRTSSYYYNKANKTNRRSPSFSLHGRRSRSPIKYPQDKYSQKSSDRYYKGKSRDRSPGHKAPDKGFSSKGKVLKDTPNTNQNLPKKLDKLSIEKSVKVKCENKLSSDFEYNESSNVLPSFRVESTEVQENISSLPYDESPEPDEKVAELAAFLKEIQQRRKLDDLSHFNVSQNLIENKTPSMDSTVLQAAIPSTVHLSPQLHQYNEINQENIDERMFYQQPYQYNSPVLANVSQYPGMNNYSAYQNPNISTPDIRSMYNSFNVDVPQQLESYFPEPDQIQSQVTLRKKNCPVRVCSLKEVPVVTNVDVQMLPTFKIKQEKEEINQAQKDAVSNKDFASDKKEFIQKKGSETSNKDSQIEELYQKLLEIKEGIQKKIEGTEKDMEELQRIKEKAEKKMRRSRNISDKQNVVQTTELLEQVQEELNVLNQQAKEVDKEVNSAKLKIAEAKKLKNIKPEPEGLKIGIEPIKFKIANIDHAKLKVSNVDSKNEMLKASKNEPVKEKGKKPNDPGTKTKTEPVRILPVVQQIRYSCYDCGSHWCQVCNEQYPSILTMLGHMHESEHKKHVDASVILPKNADDKQETNPFNTSMHPVKGIEFMSPIEGFYCSLCKETLTDKLDSEKHLKGHDHTYKYFKFIKENPVYERRYNLSKTAGLSLIYKERKKKAMEEQISEEKKKNLMKKEAEIKFKKMMQREKKLEEKIDELDETNLNMSNSPKDHKSSGIKLTLVNEKESTKTVDLKKRDISFEAKPKQQLVFIGRAPNFKPRTNTKTDLKNRIENSNKRKADQMQGPKNISECTKSEQKTNSDDCKVTQNLDTKHIDENISKSESAKKLKIKKIVDAMPAEKDKSMNDTVLSSKTHTRSGLPSDSKTSLMLSNVAEVETVKDKSAHQKNEIVIPVIAEGSKKNTKKSYSAKQMGPAANIVEIPIHEINLPSVPSHSAEKSHEKKGKVSNKAEKSSPISDPPLSVCYSEPIPPTYTYKQNQNTKTPIQKLKQNVLLTEEEQDFLLLGISKADMAPIAVPRPPPSSLIQSHEKPEIGAYKVTTNIEAAHKSPTKLSPIVVEVLKKNLPPFPPPIQVPPPSSPNVVDVLRKSLPPFPPPIQVPPPSLAVQNQFNKANVPLENKKVSKQSVTPIVTVVKDVKSKVLDMGDGTYSKISKEKELEDEILVLEVVKNVPVSEQSLTHITETNISENSKLHMVKKKRKKSISLPATITSSENLGSEVSSKSAVEKNSVDINIVSISSAPLSDEIQNVCSDKISTEKNSILSNNASKTVSDKETILSKEGSVISVLSVDKEGSSSNKIKEVSSDECEMKILNPNAFESIEPKGSAVADTIVQENNNTLQVECVVESGVFPSQKRDLKSTELSIPDDTTPSNESLHQIELGTKILKEECKSNLDKLDNEALTDPSSVIDSMTSVDIVEENNTIEKVSIVNTMESIDTIQSINTLEGSSTVKEVDTIEMETSETCAMLVSSKDDCSLKIEDIDQKNLEIFTCSSSADEKPVDISVPSENTNLSKFVDCSTRELAPEELLSIELIDEAESKLAHEPMEIDAQVSATDDKPMLESMTNTSNLESSLKSENVFQQSTGIKVEVLETSTNKSEKEEYQAPVSENLKISDISSNLKHTEKHEQKVTNVIKNFALTSEENFNSEINADILQSDISVKKICEVKPNDTIESTDEISIDNSKNEGQECDNELPTICSIELPKLCSESSLGTVNIESSESTVKNEVEECDTVFTKACSTLGIVNTESTESTVKNEKKECNTVFTKACPTELPTICSTEMPTICPTEMPTICSTEIPTICSTEMPTICSTEMPTTVCSTELPTLCSESSLEIVNIESSESTVKNEEDKMCSKSSTELVTTSDNVIKEAINDVAGDLVNSLNFSLNLEKSLSSADLKCNSEKEKVDIKESIAENNSPCLIKSQDSDLNEQDSNKLNELSESIMMEQDDSNINIFDNEENFANKTDVATTEIPESSLSENSIACVSNETNEDRTSNSNISIAESEISNATSEKSCNSLEKENVLSSDIEMNNLDSSIEETNLAASFVPCLKKFDVNDSLLNDDLSNDPPVLSEVLENEQKTDENLSNEYPGQVEKCNIHSTSESVFENLKLKEDTVDERNLNLDLAVDTDSINDIIQNFLLFPQENVVQDSCEIEKERIDETEKERIDEKEEVGETKKVEIVETDKGVAEKGEIGKTEKGEIGAAENEEIGEMEKKEIGETEKKEILEMEKKEIGEMEKKEIREIEVKSTHEQENETHHCSHENIGSDMKYADGSENENQQISCGEKIEIELEHMIQQETTEEKKEEEPETGFSKNQESVIQDSSLVEKLKVVKKSQGSNDSDTDEYETETET